MCVTELVGGGCHCAEGGRLCVTELVEGGRMGRMCVSLS